MKHLIICREYPPAPSGGIGTYVVHISRLLAEAGETVHIIGQLWNGAEREVEEKYDGRLIIHRLPLEDWSEGGRGPSPLLRTRELESLFNSGFHPQCFAWQAALLTEKLVVQEGIDVIEAQEYEAPLYYFQLRRALGLGPERHPPCIVHLHSPTEFIVRYNNGNISAPAFSTAIRLEDYSIAAADALICPSRYLTRQVRDRYALPEDAIQLIPYPTGPASHLDRNEDIWDHGTICYLGRLERRKGVIEWIDAIVDVAPDFPGARFEFVGPNVLGTPMMSGEAFVESRIPEAIRTQFLFRGPQTRSDLNHFLAGARIAVVPSRWENFPNTCIEAMCSGLPVIASPEGGMVEMVEDGRSGWLAQDAGPEGLAEALRRALTTPPATLAEMGCRAAEEVRRLCDNKTILERHLRFRHQLAKQGATRSLHFSVNLPWTKRPLSDLSARRRGEDHSKKGLVIVVTADREDGISLEGCLKNLERQTRKPIDVVIVGRGVTGGLPLKILEKVRQKEWHLLRKMNGGASSARNVAVEAILGSGLNPLGFVFVNADHRLKPGFVATCESVLKGFPEVGLVSCWAQDTRDKRSVWIKPCPGFPWQWYSNDAVPFSAVRTEALQEAGRFRPMMSDGYEDWDLINAVLANNWIAVTLPEFLGAYPIRTDSLVDLVNDPRHRSMRRELLERFPDVIARDGKEVLLLGEWNMARLLGEEISILKYKLSEAARDSYSASPATGRAWSKLKRRIRPYLPYWAVRMARRVRTYLE